MKTSLPISDNPFSTRCVRPGVLPFIFPPGQNVDMLVERLRQTAWRGEIVGPHGSGKTALLECLMPAIRRAGRQTALATLHDRQRRLPIDLRKDHRLRVGEKTGTGSETSCVNPENLASGEVPVPVFSPPAVLIVDGYEQLSRWRRLLLKLFCRHHAVGLLVSAHVSVGLPTLYRTVVTPDLAFQIIERLLNGQKPPFLREEVNQSLARHGGNLREMLFDLYDLFERQGPSAGQNVT